MVENMYLLTHSLSPVLVLVAVMKPKELKTKISHANPLTLPLMVGLLGGGSHIVSEETSRIPLGEFMGEPDPRLGNSSMTDPQIQVLSLTQCTMWD